MSWFARATDAILTSKFNKPFPVTLLPSAITFYLTEKQQARHAQLVEEIRALSKGTKEGMKEVERIANRKV